MSLPLNVVKFFTPNYLFNLQPVASRGSLIWLLVIFGLMIVAAIVLKVMKKPEHYLVNLYQKYFTFLLTMGLIGIVLVFFRYESVFVFSARFILVIWFGFVVYWLVKILRYQYKHLPESRDKSEKEKIFRKYLPKRK